MAGFRGTITDVGGPTANAFGLTRRHPEVCERCKRVSCLHPNICRHLVQDAGRFIGLLDRIRSLPNVRHLFLASGIRHDLALQTPDFIEATAGYYTGGHLKVAPEHVSPRVLELMRKPSIELFEHFEADFSKASQRCGKEQYLVPYFIVGFVGCGPREAEELSNWLSKRGQRLRQSQTFIPLAGTAAAAMAAAGKDARGRSLYIPNLKERRRQKSSLSPRRNKSRHHKRRR
jgi:uncharacterized radical SAM protein YgiQ